MLLSEKKKILFIGAHTDDVELSAGGTIAKLIGEGHDVRVYTFSYCDNMQLLLEFQRSMNVLGVKNYELNTYDNRTISYYRQNVLEDLIKYRESFYPDIVFTHDPSDLHQDHSCIGQETLRAFKFFNIISYISPWNSSADRPNFFVSLTKEQVEKKVEACKCYESQVSRFYMYEDVIHTNTSYWTNKQPFGLFTESFRILHLNYD
jgi:LmbE family N-acetylglucosaminyl deacetylase